MEIGKFIREIEVKPEPELRPEPLKVAPEPARQPEPVPDLVPA